MASLITIAQLGTTTPAEPSAQTVIASTTTAPIVEIKKVDPLIELIRTKATNAGVSASLAENIAWCESTIRQFNKNGEVLRGELSPSDVGLFQINEYYHLTRSQELGFNIYTPEGNTDYAIWLLKKEGSKHWNWSKTCWEARL